MSEPTPCKAREADAAPASVRVMELFRHYQSRPFIMVEPGGNPGDYLIYQGAEILARRAGLTFTQMDHDTFMTASIAPESVVYLHGSGGYNPWWSGTPMLELQKSVQEHPGVVIQGPSTYHDDPDFLRDEVICCLEARKAEALHLLTRERVSLAALKPLLPSWVELEVDHDTAFNVPADHFGEPLAPCWPKLYALREDKEGRASEGVRFLRHRGDPPLLAGDLETWWFIHARAASIVTDRLHSSIAGSILGRPTTLIANSYFKNRAVWEYSLERRGVAFAEHLDQVVPEDRGIRRFAARIANRRMVRRWLQKRERLL